MKRTHSNPSTIAPPAARYSHSVRVEMGEAAIIYVSGQVPVDPDNNLVGRGDVGAQTEAVFENIRKILEDAGAGMGDVVKITTYLASMEEFEKVSAVRGRVFPGEPPASSSVMVSQLLDPEWLVEIEAVAIVES